MADERDDDISRRYRELGAEQPPPELDRAILSAAREAVERPRVPLVPPGGRQRWYYSLAAAAVAIFAVAITVHFEREQPDLESTAPPAAPPPISQPSERKDEALPVQKPKLRAERPPVFAPEPGARAPAEQRAPSVPAAPPSAEEAPANAAAADAVTSGAPASSAETRAAEQNAASQYQRAPAPAANRALARAAAETPQQWLERIAELRAQGRQQDADRELAEFKRRYPDYQIPAAMRAKVERP